MLRRLLLAALLFATPQAAAAAPAPAAAPITLGETVPLETTYGNPALPAAVDVWVDMVTHATHTIDIEQFYFSYRTGERMQAIIDCVGAAAARGVKVRIMLDTNMGKTYPHPADSLGRLPHIEVRFVDYRALAGGVQHSKFMVVDGREAWLGSQNLDWRSFTHIHELGVRMREPRLAGALTAIFQADWAAAARDQKETPPVAAIPAWPLRLVQGPRDTAFVTLSASPQKTTPAGIPWDLQMIVERIAATKDTVRIQTMNYGVNSHGVVDSTLHRALVTAAQRGVPVQLLVADWTLGGAGESALRDLAAAPNISVRISQVPEWSGGYIPFSRVEHCKYMVTGDDSWIGTSNWEPGYFLNTRNVALNVHNAGIAAQLRRVFWNDWSQPTAVAFTQGTKLTPRMHGMTVPAGAKSYGE